MDETLVSFIEDVCGESHLRVEDDLGDGFVRLRSSEAERRQAKHDIRSTEDIIIEMLRNARDSGARNIFLALSREGSKRRLCMIDDGEGVPEQLHDLVFQPRITSKLDSIHVDRWGVHGRGMALFSIRENADKAIIVDSQPGKGSSFVVETNLDTLGEKSDQSTNPFFSYDEDGVFRVKGPHNINRIVAEFAYDSKDSCHVFCGSPSDIVAALYIFGESTLSKTERNFCENITDLPIVKRLVTTADPAGLADLAQDIGLPISQRSARRILDGDIKAPPEVLETICFESAVTERKGTKSQDPLKRLNKDSRGLKLATEDLEEFKQHIEKAYQELAHKYYLEDKAVPEIHITGDHISIRIDFDKIR